MAGDDRVRHCAECNLNVYNFAAMTSAEVEALVATTTGRLCGRLYQRADGTYLTKDCPEGFKIKVRRVSRIAGAALAAATAGLNFAAAQSAPINAPAVTAQKYETGIEVRVTNESHALISKADIRILDQDGNLAYLGFTSEDGRYHISNVAPGNYQLIVTSPPFSRLSQNIKVWPDRTTVAEAVIHNFVFVGEVVADPNHPDIKTKKTKRAIASDANSNN
jgi:hypothetical protein